MDLYLQFGYGMMDLSKTLVKKWKRGHVIASPRDIQPDSLAPFSKDIKKAGGDPLLDPQFYLPDADHHRLTSHIYWPSGYSTTEFWTTKQVSKFVEELVNLNIELGCNQIILPGLFAHSVDDTWLKTQGLVQTVANKLDIDDRILLATVALCHKAVSDDSQIAALLEDAESWEVDGIYLVCEHPDSEYLVSDANWITNVLDLVAGFRLQGKTVVLGYSNQQALIMGCAAASGIGSGTWMNVRSFPQEKFSAPEETVPMQRATWYYCPQALSEFKVPYLDVAHKQKLLDKLAPDARYQNEFSQMLFTGTQPSLTTFGEAQSFRHYLHCLYVQAQEAVKGTFQETIDHHRRVLDDAETLLDALHKVGIKGQNRDFMAAIDANRAAIATLDTNRGAMLKRKWASLIA